MFRTTVLATMAAAMLLTGCADRGPKETGGALLGGVGGALLGAQFGRGTGKLVATAAGALAGAWVGSELGKSLDRADRAAMDRTAGHAFEYNQSGQVAEWRNPDSGHYGTITPTRTYQEASGQPCREYQQTVTIGGRTERAYGTACRQPDGSWKIVSGS